MYKKFLFVLVICLASCSSRPQLSPNKHLVDVGKAQSEKDIEECLELADTYDRNSEEWKRIAINTTKGSIVGSAAGAVGGAIVHNAGRGVAVGAASGAVAAIVQELFRLGEGDPSKRRFAEQCLTQKGYEVTR